MEKQIDFLFFLLPFLFMKEAEIRAFINDKEYMRLLKFFKKNAKFIKEDFQITVYFSGNDDLRLQLTSENAKIWLKKGKIHDDVRDELEVFISREEFKKALMLFLSIRFQIDIVWIRRRLIFDWDRIKVCLDDTKGYGKIIELEILTEKEDEKIRNKLEEKMRELGIKITPRENFERKFKWYKENWRNLIEKDLKLGYEYLLGPVV